MRNYKEYFAFLKRLNQATGRVCELFLLAHSKGSNVKMYRLIYQIFSDFEIIKKELFPDYVDTSLDDKFNTLTNFQDFTDLQRIAIDFIDDKRKSFSLFHRCQALNAVENGFPLLLKN